MPGGPERRAVLALLGGLASAAARAQAPAGRTAVVALPGPGSSVSLPFELALKRGLDRVVGLHNNSLEHRTTAQQLAEQVLASRGVPLDSVRFQSSGMSWESMSAALRGRSVEAVMADGTLAVQLEDEGLGVRIFSTADPTDAETVPGAGFLRAALIARRDRVAAEPDRAARLVTLVRRTLQWIASHPPEALADALELQGPARRAVLSAARRYPQQYSADGRFSTRQLRETDLFFRRCNAGLPAAARFSAESMVLDRWAGRKP